MSEDRPGEGPVTSSSEAKDNLGRTSFRRPRGDHQGHKSNPTEYQASKRLARDQEDADPTELEIQMMKEKHPKAYRIYKALGLSDSTIYNMLD